MNGARYVGMGLFAIAMHAQAAEWADNDITEILDKVRKTYSEVTGDVSDAAHDVVLQQQKRTATITDTLSELLAWFDSRRTPFLDFVGTPHCGQGSPCARFRTDLRTFASDMVELKDRYPVLEQHGLGDTTFFPSIVSTLPPFVLFGLHEILDLVPGWQDLPMDLADIYDEIGDPEAFSVDLDSSPLAATSVTKHVQMTDRNTAGLGKLPDPKDPTTPPLDLFCSKGKEPHVDPVRMNRLKATLFRWKNRFDSWSEYAPDSAEATAAGEGAGNAKIPIGPILKTVSNAIDSILNQVDSYNANLEACAKIEADVAACAPMVQYRTEAGSRRAYWVVYGIWKRQSTLDAKLHTDEAGAWLAKARANYTAKIWKDAYGNVCAAYKAL